MYKLIIYVILIAVSGMSFAGTCTLADYSSNNYKNCLKQFNDFQKAKEFCTCLERNMDWVFMIKSNKFLDNKKCEFIKIKELIQEKEVLAKCPLVK
jgi:hypothetical protein